MRNPRSHPRFASIDRQSWPTNDVLTRSSRYPCRPRLHQPRRWQSCSRQLPWPFSAALAGDWEPPRGPPQPLRFWHRSPSSSTAAGSAHRSIALFDDKPGLPGRESSACHNGRRVLLAEFSLKAPDRAHRVPGNLIREGRWYWHPGERRRHTGVPARAQWKCEGIAESLPTHAQDRRGRAPGGPLTGDVRLMA